MFAQMKIVAGVVAVFAGVVSSAPNPTEPSSTSVFKVGGSCLIKWDADSTATWKSMSIQLMTGDNWNMIPITTVAQNIDATDATKNSFTYTCPEVTPTSAIYFYQFSSATDPKNLLWTTRFTIADATGATTTPTETTQPDGQSIPWGKGALADPSKAVPPPSYLSSATGSASGSAVASTSAAASASSAAGSSSAAASASASASVSKSASAANTMTTARTTARSASGSASGTSTASSASVSGAANAALGGAVPGVMAIAGAVFVAVGLF